LQRFRLGILGLGNMGFALAKGVIRSGLLEKKKVWGYDLQAEKRSKAIEELGIKVPEAAVSYLPDTSYVLVAVKPQNIKDTLEKIKDVLKEDNTIISIAAGVTTGIIEEILGKKNSVIRVMPNTPATLGKGISAISPGRFAGRNDMSFTENIMKSVGSCIRVDEKFQNAVTAISGSGPAYFFLFCKHIFKTAREIGLEEEVASLLVTETIKGAAAMISDSGHDLDELVRMVKSPGGTTEKAIMKFEEKGFEQMVGDAIKAARDRACELEGNI